jgi:AcrR family transcriptional regulator
VENKMVVEESGPPRRVGHNALIEAGADLLSGPKLADVLSFAGVRAVAERAGVCPGTVTNRFPSGARANRRSNPQLAEAIARRAVSRGFPERGHTVDALPVELGRLAQGDSEALDRIARAMADDLVAHRDQRGESFLTAYFACVAVAPRDPVAARIVREYYAAVETAFEGVFEALADCLRRRFIDGMDARRAGIALWALAEGYAVRHRGDPDSVDALEFAVVSMRLFEALTTDRSSPEAPTTTRDVVVPLRAPDRSDRAAVVAAAHGLYERGSRWDAVTPMILAAETGLGRRTVAAAFPVAGGLAAAVWSRYLAPLRDELNADRHRSVGTVLRRHAERLAAATRAHPLLAGAYLEGVVRAATRGPLDERDPVDPRAVLPLPDLLVRVLYDHADVLRPELTATHKAALAFGAVVTRTTIDLALSDPVSSATEVAGTVVGLTLDGARRCSRPGRR